MPSPFDLYGGYGASSILDELEKERQRQMAGMMNPAIAQKPQMGPAVAQKPSALMSAIQQQGGVRPEFQADLARVAQANMAPAYAQPTQTRGLPEDQNRILQEMQTAKADIARMRKGGMTPRLEAKLNEIKNRRGQSPTAAPDPVSGYRRGAGNGFTFGFGGGFNPGGMSQNAQAALQRHGAMPKQPAPAGKPPESMLLQALADLKPFGTTEQKMAKARQAAQGNSNIRTDVDPETGRTVVMGTGTPFDRIAMSPLERRATGAGKRASRLSDMKTKLASIRAADAAENLAKKGNLMQIEGDSPAAKAWNTVAAYKKKFPTASKESLMMLYQGTLTAETEAIKFKNNMKQQEALLGSNEKVAADKLALEEKRLMADIEEANKKSEFAKEQFEFTKDTTGKELANEQAKIELQDRGFTEERALKLLGQAGEWFRSNHNGRDPRTPEERRQYYDYAMELGNRAANLTDALQGKTPPVVAERPIGDTTPVSTVVDPVQAASDLRAGAEQNRGLYDVLGVPQDAPASALGRAIFERMQSRSPLTRDSLQQLREEIKKRQAVNPDFLNPDVFNMEGWNSANSAPGTGTFYLDELLNNYSPATDFMMLRAKQRRKKMMDEYNKATDSPFYFSPNPGLGDFGV